MATDPRVQVMPRTVSTKDRRRRLHVTAANVAWARMECGGTIRSIIRNGDDPKAIAVGQELPKMLHFDEICTATNRARIHGALRQKTIRCGADTSKQSVH